MNRIQRYLETSSEEPHYGDFVVVRFDRFGCARDEEEKEVRRPWDNDL